MRRMRDKGSEESEEKYDFPVEAYDDDRENLRFEKDNFSVKVIKIGELTITICEDNCEGLTDD